MPDPDPMDCDGHGTFVSGVIGADGPLFSGVAPNVTLGMYRVFGCAGGSSDDVLIAAYVRAFESGGKGVEYCLWLFDEYFVLGPADTISASLNIVSGWTENPTTVLVSRIVEAGIPCISAADNNGDQGR